MSSTIPTNLVNPTNNITVLRVVIPTPTSVGLTFDSQGATRQVDEVCAFFKDQNYTREDRHEQILCHVDITLRDNIRAIPEYTRTPFNKEAFFTVLKKKYCDYNDDYTKHTRPFLDALVLLA